MSGGTLIALAADRIVMCEHAVLGPIDPQIGGYPAASILRAVARKEAKDVDEEFLVLADQSELAVAQLRRAVLTILEPRLRADLAENVARVLSEGQWTHDYPITPAEASGLGLVVETAMPDTILRMMSLYPQPLRRTPSVEYGTRRRALPDPENKPSAPE
jgi:ClpP class serine protease